MLRACSLDATIFHLVRQQILFFFCTLSGRVAVANEKMSWIFLSLFYNSNVRCTVNMCDTQKFIFHISEHTKFHTREFSGDLFFILSQDKRRFASVLESTHTEKSQARVRGEGKSLAKKKSFYIFTYVAAYEECKCYDLFGLVGRFFLFYRIHVHFIGRLSATLDFSFCSSPAK